MPKGEESTATIKPGDSEQVTRACLYCRNNYAFPEGSQPFSPRAGKCHYCDKPFSDPECRPGEKFHELIGPEEDRWQFCDTCQGFVYGHRAHLLKDCVKHLKEKLAHAQRSLKVSEKEVEEQREWREHLERNIDKAKFALSRRRGDSE